MRSTPSQNPAWSQNHRPPMRFARPSIAANTQSQPGGRWGFAKRATCASKPTAQRTSQQHPNWNNAGLDDDAALQLALRLSNEPVSTAPRMPSRPPISSRPQGPSWRDRARSKPSQDPQQRAREQVNSIFDDISGQDAGYVCQRCSCTFDSQPDLHRHKMLYH